MGFRGIKSLEIPRLTRAVPITRKNCEGKTDFLDSLRMVAETRAAIGDAAAINACRGIFTADDASRTLESGAD